MMIDDDWRHEQYVVALCLNFVFSEIPSLVVAKTKM